MKPATVLALLASAFLAVGLFAQSEQQDSQAASACNCDPNAKSCDCTLTEAHIVEMIRAELAKPQATAEAKPAATVKESLTVEPLPPGAVITHIDGVPVGNPLATIRQFRTVQPLSTGSGVCRIVNGVRVCN